MKISGAGMIRVPNIVCKNYRQELCDKRSLMNRLVPVIETRLFPSLIKLLINAKCRLMRKVCLEDRCINEKV